MSTTSHPTTIDRPTRRGLAWVLVAAVVATLASVALPAAPAEAGTCPGAYAMPFSDIGHAHPFCAEIHSAHAQGWITGYADGEFKPTNVVTRQAAAAILWRVANTDNLQQAPKPCEVAPFPDVPVDHPFCGHIRDAVAAGVFTGYADGTFHPSAPMTRRAMAMVLVRFPYGNIPTLHCAPSPYTDVPADDDLCAKVNTLALLGIMHGYADGTFRPDDAMTRQAFAAVADRASTVLV